jgi:RNA polymerase sigma-70 factor (ECF subfamily)
MNRLALDDAAVIEASRAEPDRFASLFDRHAPYIHRYLARRVGTQAADAW